MLTRKSIEWKILIIKIISLKWKYIHDKNISYWKQIYFDWNIFWHHWKKWFNENIFYWIQIYFDWMKIYFDNILISIFTTFQQPCSGPIMWKMFSPFSWPNTALFFQKVSYRTLCGGYFIACLSRIRSITPTFTPAQDTGLGVK